MARYNVFIKKGNIICNKSEIIYLIRRSMKCHNVIAEQILEWLTNPDCDIRYTPVAHRLGPGMAYWLVKSLKEIDIYSTIRPCY